MKSTSFMGLLLTANLIFGSNSPTLAKDADPATLKKLGTALIKGDGVVKNLPQGLQLLETAAQKDISAKVTLGNMFLTGGDVPKDVERGIKLLTEAADSDNASALYILGSALLGGPGITADPAKAHQYLDRATALGSVGAQVKLGETLIRGIELPADKPAGLKLLEAALDKSIAAKVSLGAMLIAGVDLPRDIERGLKLLNEAADAKSTSALNALANAYFYGTSVPADPVKAREYLERAIALGDGVAQAKLGEALIKGGVFLPDKTAGRNLLESALDKYVGAKISLGNLLLAGTDLPADTERGLKLLNEAAGIKNTVAMNALADAYLQGKSIPADPVKARHYFDDAIALGDVTAQVKLGEALIKGQTLPADKVAGQKLLEASLEKSVSAKVILGSMLLTGADLAPDAERGITLLGQAAEVNNVAALNILANAYLKGKGVAASPQKARELFDKAIALGSVGAKVTLGLALIKGTEIAPDRTLGLKMLEGVADKSLGAKLTLGNLLLSGTDVPRDAERGIKLLDEVSNLNNIPALNILGNAYLSGNGVAADPVKADQYLRKAIALGDSAAEAKLGEALIKGQGVHRDAIEGKRLLLAAATNDVAPKVALARLLLNGIDLPRDVILATKLANEAATNSNPNGLLALGTYYLSLKPIGKNEPLARAALLKAGKLGSPIAWRLLAQAVAFKQFRRDKNSYAFYASKALAAGDKGIAVVEARRYLYGLGVPANTKKFLAILTQNAASGNVDAIKSLITAHRDGVQGRVAKNLKSATLAINKYSKYLTPVQSENERFFITLAGASGIKSFHDILNDINAVRLYLRPENQSSMMAANRNFMVYRLQAGLVRGGFMKQAPNGLATKATFAAASKACFALRETWTCNKVLMSPDNVFHIATKW